MQENAPKPARKAVGAHVDMTTGEDRRGQAGKVGIAVGAFIIVALLAVFVYGVVTYS